MDVYNTLMTTGLGSAMVAITALVGKVITTDKALSAHIAGNMATELSFKDLFIDLKAEARDQSQKLDRLIEQNMNRATDAMVARGAVSAAAATALDVVENAKISALAIIAHAASEAKKLT
jgi:hypothetical protein